MSKDIGSGRGGASGLRTDSGTTITPAALPNAVTAILAILALQSLGLLALPEPALAAEPNAAFRLGGMLSEGDLLYLSVLAFVIGAVMLAATFMVRQQAVLQGENAELQGHLHDARLKADARTAILVAGGERILVFAGTGLPEVIGQMPGDGRIPDDPERFLIFADWMPAEAVGRLEAAIAALLDDATPFRIAIDLDTEFVIEASGRTSGGLAMVKFTVLQGLRKRLDELTSALARAEAEVETMQQLFDQAPVALWMRDRSGRLTWVNRAYAAAVDAPTVGDALERQVEFLSAQDRLRVAKQVAENRPFTAKLSTVVESDRRNFNVVEAVGPTGSAGLAIDVSETEQVRMELHQTIESQSETLDQLATAVARFDEKTRLAYYNAAFQRLFDLTNAYLETEPDHVTLLDHLRTRGILPTEKLVRSEMREQDLAAYRATEPTEDMWHLADGRTLRVIATPQPRGGATWVFEDITEKLELESQVKATVRLQRETIDYLSEAVAVFGSDGRMRLSNPAFAEMWGIDPAHLTAGARIQALADLCRVKVERTLGPGGVPEPGLSEGWRLLIEQVTAFDDHGRDTLRGEISLSDGGIFNYTIVPLPNGLTMLTFSNISEARAAELVLRERNDALEQANQIKTDFVQHVNYELRSPLTNIIGFSALLRSAETGPLNERQSEYLDYISSSTSTLLTIVNDILDLATVDAGIMELELSDVDIARTVEQAADGVRDRFEAADISLRIDLADAGTSFNADGHRLTQILFNLLSNAANFAPAGSVVGVRVWRRGGQISFEVSDHGPGIASNQIDKIFERFEADPSGGRQSGAGLGLSIVKSFVELHHGHVEVRSTPGSGTAVICHFPLGNFPPDEDSEGSDRYWDAAE
ncbi:PAS domain-containing sensor histidine kinase [Jiella avicenniae]|uniref:histidine kinase n=1 Tax=Jiella avicenniae TaxID=2907202 RepID=A0A9X1T4F8_9HYPH|nr:PAS domain-containing sensor histidine kinase [Jiella avicenniae]MCE7027897.1 PAS-domain containing protein [Jiella avicenniae]